MVRGFYNESLAGGRRFAARWRMKPALLVDLDCDLYTSSVQALEFLLSANALAIGTFVYYDDISWDQWRADGAPMEEKRAHIEISERYGLEWRLLPRRPSEEFRMKGGKFVPLHWRPVFVLVGCRTGCVANVSAVCV